MHDLCPPPLLSLLASTHASSVTFIWECMIVVSTDKHRYRKDSNRRLLNNNKVTKYFVHLMSVIPGRIAVVIPWTHTASAVGIVKNE
jgi:hypothetical protein